MAKIKRIFVCDDDKDVLYMVTFVVTGMGWEIFTSNDCQNIVEKVREVSPSVILMDINFPENRKKTAQHLKEVLDLSGVKITQDLKLHPETKHIPVIIFSSADDIASLAEEAGTKLFLKKPFEIDRLEKIISRAYNESM